MHEREEKIVIRNMGTLNLKAKLRNVGMWDVKAFPEYVSISALSLDTLYFFTCYLVMLFNQQVTIHCNVCLTFFMCIPFLHKVCIKIFVLNIS